MLHGDLKLQDSTEAKGHHINNTPTVLLPDKICGQIDLPGVTESWHKGLKLTHLSYHVRLGEMCFTKWHGEVDACFKLYSSPIASGCST